MRRWQASSADIFAAAILTCGLLPEAVKAEPWAVSIEASQQAPTLEASAGADVAAHSWSVYSGLTASIGGSLYENGWRLRLAGGHGGYSYSSRPWDADAQTPVTVSYDGSMTFADALAGYQQQLGALTLKVFGGAAMQHNTVTPVDPNSTTRGTRWGAKGAVEAWLDIGTRTFAQLDLSYATVYDTYGSRLRLGYKLTPQFSIGPEAGLHGSIDYDHGRAGAFVRYESEMGEISISGGAAGEDGYATVNALLRF